MADAGTQKPVLSYAAAIPPTKQSRYSFASIAVSAIAILWLVLTIVEVPLPFDGYKQHRIGTVASVLSLIFSIAGYWQPNRKRSMTHVAITIAALTFFAYILATPL